MDFNFNFNPFVLECPCKGHGWVLSNFDSWHSCHYHGIGVPHPEDEHTPFDLKEHRLKLLRQDYVHYARSSGVSPKTFREAVELVVDGNTPEDFVRAAAIVADELKYMAWLEEK